MAIKCSNQMLTTVLKKEGDVKDVERPTQFVRFDYEDGIAVQMRFTMLDLGLVQRSIVVDVDQRLPSAYQFRNDVLEHWQYQVRPYRCNTGDVAVAYYAVRPRSDMAWLTEELYPLDQINGTVT